MPSRGKESLLNKVKNDVAKSGYPLEIEVSSILEKFPAWGVENQVLCIHEEWKNSEEMIGIPGTVDIVAAKHLARVKFYHENEPVYHGFFSLYLIIECKKSDKPWLFFIRDRPKVDSKRKAKFLITTPYEDARRPFKNLEFLERSHYSKFQKKAIISYEPFTGGEGRLIAKGANQVIRALEYFRRIYAGKEGDSVKVFYPLIVFDGDMFESWLENGELQYGKTDYVQFVVKKPIDFLTGDYAEKREETYIVEVLSKSFLKEYLRMLDAELRKMSDEFAEAFPPIEPKDSD